MTITPDFALMAGYAYRTSRGTTNRFPIPTGWNEIPNSYYYFSTRKDVNRLPFPSSNGWQPLDPESGLDRTQDDTTGFEGAAFVRGDEILISFAGTYPDPTFLGSIDGQVDLRIGAMGMDNSATGHRDRSG
jgi:hypothetical protein